MVYAYTRYLRLTTPHGWGRSSTEGQLQFMIPPLLRGSWGIWSDNARRQHTTLPLWKGARGEWSNDNAQLCLCKGALEADGPTAREGNMQLYREALGTNDPIVHDDNEGKLSQWGRRKTHDVLGFTRDSWYLMLKSSLNLWGRRIPEVLDVFACDHRVGLEGSLMPPQATTESDTRTAYPTN